MLGVTVALVLFSNTVLIVYKEKSTLSRGKCFFCRYVALLESRMVETQAVWKQLMQYYKRHLKTGTPILISGTLCVPLIFLRGQGSRYLFILIRRDEFI